MSVSDLQAPASNVRFGSKADIARIKSFGPRPLPHRIVEPFDREVVDVPN
jgi:hypothetical protein